MTVPTATTGSTASSWRMPAEWEPHEACLMAWPTRASMWRHHLDAARHEYVATAAAISDFEPVIMVVDPADAGVARSMLPSTVQLVELAIDDSWFRDSGPIFLLDDVGRRRGADFGFNAWGEKFEPWDADATIGRRMLEHLGEERVESPMILEGGSITTDGRGTFITTAQCNLHPNRNPDMEQAQIESELGRVLGAHTVVWLPWGLVDDFDTDGHVDNVCAFVRPGVVIAHGPGDDPSHPDHARMSENLEVLASATTASGEPIEVIELPHVSRFDIDGESHRNSYVNFYVANGGVVVPVADHPNDEAALAIIADAFPEREVVGVNARILAFGGGGVHCITQQLPAVSLPRAVIADQP